MTLAVEGEAAVVFCQLESALAHEKQETCNSFWVHCQVIKTSAHTLMNIKLWCVVEYVIVSKEQSSNILPMSWPATTLQKL